MKVTRGTPPATVERPISVDLTREEVLTVLVGCIRAKLGPNIRLDDLSVEGDNEGKMQTISLSGVEIIPINWKSDSIVQPTTPLVVTPAPQSVSSPSATPAAK